MIGKTNSRQVIDVGTALSRMLEDDDTASQTYELYGPTNYSMAEIAELVDREIYKRRRHLNLPKKLLQPAAKALNQFLWWRTTSADEVEREFLDQIIDPKAKTFADLEITPADLSNYTFHYLVRESSCPCNGAPKAYGAHSKVIAAQHSTTCRLRRRGRNERRRSICM